MNATTFEEWAAQYAKLFGLLSPVEVEMVGDWSEHFRSEGYSVAELVAASQALARDAPPRYRSEHLGALTEALVAGRRPVTTEPPREATSCGLCDGCGRVSVPNPRTLDRARHKWTWLSVTCSCPLGLWWHEHLCSRQPSSPERRVPQPLSLADYEKYHLPDWREVLSARRRHEESLRTQTGRARELDDILGPVIDRLRRAGPPTPDSTKEAR